MKYETANARRHTRAITTETPPVTNDTRPRVLFPFHLSETACAKRKAEGEGVPVYHLKASFGSRSGGQSARAKSDYIEREGRYEKDGEELEHKEHGNMPEWAEDDPGKYWEAADEHERANGRLYSEVQFAIPKESDHVAPSPRPVPESATQGAWGAVYGELLTFDDPYSSLPPIDRLEDFRPGGHSLYRRLLVLITVNGAREVAWVYTVEATRIKRRRIVSGC